MTTGVVHLMIYGKQTFLFTFGWYICTLKSHKWVSEWLLLNANSAISWREQVNFQWKDDELHFVLDQQAKAGFLVLAWIFIVLAHWNKCAGRHHVAPLEYISFWFRANQSLLSLLKAVCLSEKQQIPILVIDETRPGAPTHDLTH